MRRPELLALLLLLVLPSPLLADDPDVERAMERQNELAQAKDADSLLKESMERLNRGDTAENRFLLGRAFELLGKFDKAREQYEWALERDPTCAYAYLGLGNFHRLKGNLAEAEKQLRNALKLDKRLSLAHLELAALLTQQGEPGGAIRELLAVLAYAPKNQHARHLLGDLYYLTNRFEKAAHEYRALLELAPGFRKVERKLFLSLVRARENEEALKLGERLLKSDPKDTDIYRLIARVRLRLGDDAEAIAVLERLLAVLPKDSPLARDTRAEIAKIRRGEAGEEQVGPEVVLRELSSDNVEVRRRAMRTLMQYEMNPPRKEMLERLKDEDELMRVYAVRYLGRIKWRRGVWFLEMALLHEKERDPSEKVRGQAARALATCGFPVAVPMLLRALEDESHYVFKIAIESLRVLTGRYFTDEPLAAPKPEEREALRERWAAWWRGPRALSAKLDAIEDIERFTHPRFRVRFLFHLCPLLTDSERIVAARARKAFGSLTGVVPGKDEDLATREGRQRIYKAAMAVLDGRIDDKGKKPEEKPEKEPE